MSTGTTSRRTSRARCLVAAASIGAVSVAAGVAETASAGFEGPLSAGCMALNQPSLDAVYVAEGIGPLQFTEGETITVSAGRPVPGGTPAATNLTVDDGVVAFGNFPATLHYTVPADGIHDVAWRVNAFGATWDVSCRPACTITGTPNADVLAGTAGDDVICGLGGADVIDGREGNDMIFGGAGGDVIRGSGGQDQLFGEAGGDVITGRDGSAGDIVTGGGGVDAISSDPGDIVTQ